MFVLPLPSDPDGDPWLPRAQPRPGEPSPRSRALSRHVAAARDLTSPRPVPALPSPPPKRQPRDVARSRAGSQNDYRR